MAKISRASASTLTIRTTSIITAIWSGVMGLGFAAQYLLPEQLFALLVLALALGAVLTALTFWFTLSLAEVVLDGGGDVVIEARRKTEGKPPQAP
ncbi:MAG TPA: hypothetical protein VGB42_05545 [Candidatus Thermoplasmatota archaeon]